jgi:hypothetical protein
MRVARCAKSLGRLVLLAARFIPSWLAFVTL